MAEKKTYKSYLSEIITNLECWDGMVKSVTEEYTKERKKLKKKLKKYTDFKRDYEIKLEEVKKEYQLMIDEEAKEYEILLSRIKSTNDTFRKCMSDKDNLLEEDPTIEPFASSSSIILDAKVETDVFEGSGEARSGGQSKKRKMKRNEESNN